MANSVDTNAAVAHVEQAHVEPPHLDLYFVKIQLFVYFSLDVFINVI